MNRYNRMPPGTSPAPRMRPRPMPAPSAVRQECHAMPLAVPFVQLQSWGEVFEPETALCKGTIFPALDLPFCGSGVRRR